MKLEHAAVLVGQFEGTSLTERLASLERQYASKSLQQTNDLNVQNGCNDSLIESAAILKKLAGQINVVVHAVGILVSLPSILDESETIEYLSLGAGNTGRDFDLETNLRIAEFKFTDWKGGPEAIRQNSLFKDFYDLAEFKTPKKRCLYVLGLQFPLKFLNGSRSMDSVLSRNNKLLKKFHERHGNRYDTVGGYYKEHENLVNLIDLSEKVPSLLKLTT